MCIFHEIYCSSSYFVTKWGTTQISKISNIRSLQKISVYNEIYLYIVFPIWGTPHAILAHSNLSGIMDHSQYECTARGTAHYIGSISYNITDYIPRLCTLFTLCHVLFWFNNGQFNPYPSGLLHWHWGNHTIAPVPVKQPWMIWVYNSHEFTKH